MPETFCKNLFLNIWEIAHTSSFVPIFHLSHSLRSGNPSYFSEWRKTCAAISMNFISFILKLRFLQAFETD